MHHISERVDDNSARLSMEAGMVRVLGLVDKQNFLVNALHMNTCHIRIFFFQFFTWRLSDKSLLSVFLNQTRIIFQKL